MLHGVSEFVCLFVNICRRLKHFMPYKTGVSAYGRIPLEVRVRNFTVFSRRTCVSNSHL